MATSDTLEEAADDCADAILQTLHLATNKHNYLRTFLCQFGRAAIDRELNNIAVAMEQVHNTTTIRDAFKDEHEAPK